MRLASDAAWVGSRHLRAPSGANPELGRRDLLGGPSNEPQAAAAQTGLALTGFDDPLCDGIRAAIERGVDIA